MPRTPGIVVVLALIAVVGCQPEPARKPAEGGAANPTRPAESATDAAARSAAPGAASPTDSAADPGKAGEAMVTDAGVKPAAVPQDVPADQPEPPLGEPLVNDVKALIRLHPEYDVWVDKPGRRVVMLARVCGRDVPLEMFATLKNTKEYESILAINTKAQVVHAALVVVGAEAGNPARFSPDYLPARGTAVDIDLIWKDAQGQQQKARGQDWVRNTKSKKPIDHRWVFAGSGIWTHPETKESHYQAESGDLICVANFSSATLDIDVRSTASNEALEFEAFTERIPPKGTPVTLVLTPQPGSFKAEKPAAAAKPEAKAPAEAAKTP